MVETLKSMIKTDAGNCRGMGGNRRHNVHGNDDAFSKIKFKIPPFDGKYDPDAYITWEIAVDQKFACHAFPETTRVRAATSEFTDFASVWWIYMARKILITYHTLGML